MSPNRDPDAPKHGRWAYFHTTGEWWWSPEVLRATGTTHAPKDVQHFLDRMPDQTERDELAELLAEASAAGGSMAGQFTLTTPAGERIFAIVADTIFDAQGTALEFRGYSTDVTEEVRLATRAAVDAATRHRRAIEQVKGALMVTYRIDEVTAFALLRQQSNTHNVKLNVLSEHVSRAMGAAPRGAATVPLMELIEGVAKRLQSGRDDLPPGPEKVAT